MVTVVPGLFCALHRLLHCRLPATFLPCGGLVHAVQVLEESPLAWMLSASVSLLCDGHCVLLSFYLCLHHFPEGIKRVSSWIPWRMTKQLPARFLWSCLLSESHHLFLYCQLACLSGILRMGERQVVTLKSDSHAQRAPRGRVPRPQAVSPLDPSDPPTERQSKVPLRETFQTASLAPRRHHPSDIAKRTQACK